MTPPRIPKTLRALFQPAGPVGEKDRLVVAVSGGRDSMCLLHALVAVHDHPDECLVVVHVNHHLRTDSGRDEALVASFCVSHGLALHALHLEPDDKPVGSNLEEWCREQRYAIFETIRNREKAQWIFTAHHSGDQAETLLMHLVQGSGSRGLRGIHFRRGNLLRPFLNITPREIMAYTTHNQVPFRDDVSNRDERLNRNYLRLNVLPLLEQRFPGIFPAVNRTSQIMEETETVIRYALGQLKETLSDHISDKCIEIPYHYLETVPLLLQVRLLQDLCRVGGQTRNHDWNRLKQFLQQGKTGTVISVGQYSVLRDRQMFIIEKTEPALREAVAWDMNSRLMVQGLVFQSRPRPKPHTFPAVKHTEIVNDAYLTGKAIQIRTWKPGDRFIPLGMRKAKKISDFLTDNKMNVFSKRRQLVMTANDEIVWVCGQRISDTVKVFPGCETVRELTAKPMDE